MTIGFTLHVGPITGMLETLRQEDQFHSKDTLSAESHLRSFALRSCIAIIVALLAHRSRNFATFLNMQGAILSNLLTIILPCLCYIRLAAPEPKRKAGLNLVMLASSIVAFLIVLEW
jgi:hypothetical protein